MDLTSGAVALTFGSALGWAVLDLLRRGLVGRVGAMALVAWMTIGALPPLVAWAAWSAARPVEGGYFAPALLSVALNLVANFLYFRALELSPLSLTLPMLSFTPAFAALLGALFLAERMGIRGVLGLVAVVAGAFLLTFRSGRGFHGLLEGIAHERGARWMIAVAFLWSATLLLDKRAVGFAAPQLHALVLNGGVAIGALATLAGRGELRALAAIRGHLLLWVGAVVVSAAALGSQLVALESIPLGVLETVKRGVGGALAVVWGRLFYREPVTARKLLAVALMTAGVAFLVL